VVTTVKVEMTTGGRGFELGASGRMGRKKPWETIEPIADTQDCAKKRGGKSSAERRTSVRQIFRIDGGEEGYLPEVHLQASDDEFGWLQDLQKKNK